MRSKEISFWKDEREYAALQDVLERKGTNVEAEMTGVFAALYQREVPETVRNSIREEIRAEELEAAQQEEAARRSAVFHITEGGQEYWVRQERPMEFMDAAIAMYRYLTAEPGQREPSLASSLRGAESISRKQFTLCALERLEEFGRVTGTFDIDLDRGEFTTLRDDAQWRAYHIKDVSAAAYRATRGENILREQRAALFSERLEGWERPSPPVTLEVGGSRRLQPEDIAFAGRVDCVNLNLSFFLPRTPALDEVLGTHVLKGGDGSYLAIFADYSIAHCEVQECLDVVFCHSNDERTHTVYRMDEDEQAVMLERMQEYFQLRGGQDLKEYAASLWNRISGPRMTM